MPSYSPSSTKGVALREVTQDLIAKGAVELAPLPSPGFYSRLFVVWKTSGSGRPVIDLSTLNRFVDVSHFQMETIQSVRQGDWMASIDLWEAYLQIPVHPESLPFLRFVAQGRVYQFCALCFGLSMAPQVFTLVMATVSAILHSWGIRLRRYLNDWLVQSSSRESLLRDLQVVLDLCRELGIVINPEKSNLEPSQVIQYLGVVINAQSYVASPSPDRVSRLLSTAGEFLSSAAPPASVWLSLLGMLSSMSHLVPRWPPLHAVPPALSSPGLGLHGPVDQDSMVSGLSSGSAVVAPNPSPRAGGVPLAGVSRPRLLVRRLGRGLGGTYGSSHRFRPLERNRGGALHQHQGAPGSSSGSPPPPVLSGGENGCSLLRQCHGGRLPPQGGGHEVSLPELPRSGDPPLVRVTVHPSGSSVNSGLTQCPGEHSVLSSPAPSYRVVPQHGDVSFFASLVAGPDRLVCHLGESPLFDLFLSLPGSPGGRHRRPSPALGRSPGVRFSFVVHHSPSSFEAPAVAQDGAHLSGSVLAPEAWVSGPPSAVAGTSGGSAGAPRPPPPASVSSTLPGSPQASVSCPETLRRFTRAAGFYLLQ